MSAPSPLDFPSLAGLTLLVVDDDPDSIEVLAIFLTALTVTGALTYVAEARKLDAVVTDIAMPGIDGVEVIFSLLALVG